MFKGYGLTGVAGLASGLVFLSAIGGGALGIPLIHLVPLPLMMVGLSAGFLHALAASVLAAVVVALVTVHAVPSFAVVAVLPSLLLVRQALLRRWHLETGDIDWYPPGKVLLWLTGAAVGLLLLGAAVLASQGLNIEELVGRHVLEFVNKMPVAAPAEVRDALIGLWSAIMPAMACCVWLTIAALNGVLAQWTAAKAGTAIRATPTYGDIVLPVWVAGVLAVAAAIGFLAKGDLGYVARNVAIVLLWPHLFVGVAEIHRLLKDRPNRLVLLTLFYVVFVVLFQWALFAVAGLGLVRHWTRPRRRDAGGQEEK
ncbi:MAG TPA: hypothetical protein VM661_13055 [Candidatus Sulfotelmatobacter sp.]|jgi:hypothetical protein|nr:hypothetical protein [Candidatus Sulfotelmatobacter sp.]